MSVPLTLDDVPPATTVKVAQVLAGADYGGAESFYLRLLEALSQHPELHQKAFVRPTDERQQRLDAAGIESDFFRFGNALHWQDRRQFLKALKNFEPDVVLTWMNRASGLTPRGPYKLVSRLGHYYNLKYYRHADYWIGITKGICDHLIAGGMPAKRIFHIPNFADETPVTPVERSQFDTPADAPLLLAAGRLHKNKGFDVLLEALADLPGFYLWLAGDGPEKSRLHRQAKKLQLQQRIRFLGWRRDVTALMCSADMFICPSRHEGLGSIVLEAWAHGCPIVAANSQGPGELIQSGKDGTLVPIDDSGALAKAIKRLHSNPQLRQELACTARTRYFREFSQAAVSQQYLDCFRSLSSHNSFSANSFSPNSVSHSRLNQSSRPGSVTANPHPSTL